jgi:hypothetical protein
MEKLLLYKHRHTNSGGGKSKTAALAIALDQLKRLLQFFSFSEKLFEFFLLFIFNFSFSSYLIGHSFFSKRKY